MRRGMSLQETGARDRRRRGRGPRAPPYVPRRRSRSVRCFLPRRARVRRRSHRRRTSAGGRRPTPPVWKSYLRRYRRDNITLVDFHAARCVEDRLRAVFADVVAPQSRVPPEGRLCCLGQVLLQHDDIPARTRELRLVVAPERLERRAADGDARCLDAGHELFDHDVDALVPER